MKKNNKKTDKDVTKKAAKILSSDNSSKIQKKLAASALAQSGTKKQTGAKMEGVASDVLKSNKYSSETKQLAASILSQSNKERKE
jgi:hypothetical protein